MVPGQGFYKLISYRKNHFAPSVMKKLLFIALGLATGALAHSQDLHYSRIHEMRTWYNQALQMDRQATGALNYRTLDYQGIIAFRTATGLVDVPLLRREARDDNKGYLSLTGGVSIDKSNSRVLQNFSGMAGISYSLPVNAARNTYVAAGFQGGFFQNRVNLGTATLPDQYDNYRLVPNRATADPYGNAEVHYISLNAGLSIFHKSEAVQWYAGASMRHLNEPQASNSKGAGYNLPRTYSAQLGYVRQLDGDQRIGLHTALNWKAEAYEHLANLQYNYEFNRFGFDRGLGFGLGYRFQDAVIPNFEFRLEKTTFGFNYDINVGGIKNVGMRRRSMEVGIKHRF